MKRQTVMIYGLAAAVLAGSTLALAGEHGGQGRGDPEQRMQRMQDHLGLSEEQVAELRAIRASDVTREEKRARMQSVFTDEQRALIEEHRANRGDRGAHHGRRGSEFEAEAN